MMCVCVCVSAQDNSRESCTARTNQPRQLWRRTYLLKYVSEGNGREDEAKARSGTEGRESVCPIQQCLHCILKFSMH